MLQMISASQLRHGPVPKTIHLVLNNAVHCRSTAVLFAVSSLRLEYVTSPRLEYLKVLVNPKKSDAAKNPDVLAVLNIDSRGVVTFNPIMPYFQQEELSPDSVSRMNIKADRLPLGTRRRIWQGYRLTRRGFQYGTIRRAALPGAPDAEEKLLPDADFTFVPFSR